MSRGLDFRPQKAFSKAYNLDAKVILEKRSVFSDEYDYFVDKGGRGGGKTKDKIKAVVIESTLRCVRVLVTREIQNSIDESVKAEIEACIDEMGLRGSFFKITDTYIEGRNGSYFMFRGIKNNINNLKSISDVDIVIVEEAENVTKLSWDKLLPSIRPNSGRAIVIVIFNPANILDNTYQRFIIDTPPRTLITTVNYGDNKYFPEFLEKQRIHAKRTMPKADYENIWEGKPKGSGGDVIIDFDWINAARFASRNERWVNAGINIVGYDPAGQGRDFNAVACCEGNRLVNMDEWLKSTDLREASERAINGALEFGATAFRYDECGGLGDGVAVFVDDAVKAAKQKQVHAASFISIEPFNAGNGVANANELIEGTEKTNEQQYSNIKAQSWGILAQLFYNTFRFIELGEDVPPEQMISIDVEDNDTYIKLARELSSPLWVKSLTNSKKKVEDKKAMDKRTGQPSPNLADALVMCFAPRADSSFEDFLSLRRRR
jgi:phage terminase large subunit